MASGSNAPFSGEFVDLENVPKLPEGISAGQIFEQNADAIRQAAEARHAAGLSQVNADGGFFDAFVDTGKISSKSGTSITNLSLQLTKKVVDNFEDGSLSEYGGSTSNIFVSSNNPIDGTKSLVFDADSVDVKISRSITPAAPSEFSFKFRVDDFSDLQNSTTVVLDIRKNGTAIAQFSINGNRKVQGTEFIETQTNLSGGVVHEVEFKNIDFSNETYDIFINGDQVKTSVSFGSSASEIDGLNIAVESEFEGDSLKATLDSINHSEKGRVSSGTVTEQQFTFTDTQGNAFSPSKVGIFPDQTLNGQSITYDLKDSTGTVVKTFNQSDLNQLQSVNTTDTTFQVEANLSGNGSQTPELEFLDVRGV